MPFNFTIFGDVKVRVKLNFARQETPSNGGLKTEWPKINTRTGGILRI